jgi:hypothetical protein
MKKYLLGLLKIRMIDLTDQLNKLENQYRGATASGLSGLGASVDEIKNEMEKIKSYQERLKEMELD